MAGGSSTGFHPHLPGLRYRFLSKALGATMWFFIFYRAREDGAKLLYGLGPQLTAHDHHDDHGAKHH
ncbi:hypothetical protein M422DRAFT_785218 [Sphaerobolus stellatus SS14]|uniref:Uncharacterized protein n=1 Tax=Sphaerobolus stellatus (strain SS14) TaxID=990650 RepID=A0A0C9TBP5_SPHS4|nr:hypothetical protein M422DRAFT_785218 [Sphaerobolus stellatus SS14]